MTLKEFIIKNNVSKDELEKIWIEALQEASVAAELKKAREKYAEAAAEYLVTWDAANKRTGRTKEEYRAAVYNNVMRAEKGDLEVEYKPQKSDVDKAFEDFFKAMGI